MTAGSSGTGGPRLSVVVVDDSPELRGVVVRALESSGQFVVVGQAGDGDEALRVVTEQEPSVLLIDVSMPSVDGLETLPWMTAAFPDMTVVVFTGFEDAGLVGRARDLGAADVIEKSIRLGDLPRRLLRILGEQRLVESAVPATATDEEQPDHERAAPRLTVVGRGGDDHLDEVTEGQVLLDEHVQQFRQLFDRAAIGMATMTVRGTVVRANAALARMMSCEPGDLVGEDYGRLTSGAGERLDGALEAVLSGEQDIASFEHAVPVAPGLAGRQVARVTLAPIRDSYGRVLYVFAQVQDISAQRSAEAELRRSEETFRLLVTSVDDFAIYMLDTLGRVVSWNAGARRLKGWTEEEVVGRSFSIFYPQEDRESGRPEQVLATALREGGLSEEGWRVRKDGSRFWAEVTLRPVVDDVGRHVGFTKVTRDRSATRELELRLQDLVGEQTHLLAVTAHELRTPTAVIDGAVGLLSGSWEDLPATERAELLGSIQSSVHRLSRLAGDLATLARVEGRDLGLRREVLSVTEVLGRAVTRARTSAPDADISCEVTEESLVEVDEHRVEQVLDNLLDNALRHGRPPYAVSADGSPTTTCIRISDGGTGVAAELVPRLFERFATGDRARGTGLGLFLVREIVRAHGGDVTYHPPTGSVPTTFEVTLPRAVG